MYKSKTLSEYDYGETGNLLVYNSTSPSKYKIENWKDFTIPSFITISDSDPFSSPDDVMFFINKVEDKSKIYIKNLKDYNHLDYVWSDDAKEDIYLELISFLEK